MDAKEMERRINKLDKKMISKIQTGIESENCDINSCEFALFLTIELDGLNSMHKKNKYCKKIEKLIKRKKRTVQYIKQRPLKLSPLCFELYFHKQTDSSKVDLLGMLDWHEQDMSIDTLIPMSQRNMKTSIKLIQEFGVKAGLVEIKDNLTFWGLLEKLNNCHRLTNSILQKIENEVNQDDLAKYKVYKEIVNKYYEFLKRYFDKL